MTGFDQISAHSFRHPPSLGALGGWLLPLWCKNMPFGKSTALWRALLNYPKTFSSCTFITPREDKQGERAALKDRHHARKWWTVDWDAASKGRLPRAAFIVPLLIQQNHLWNSNRLPSKHWLWTRSLRMTKATEELKPAWSGCICTPPHWPIILQIVSFYFSYKRKTRLTLTGSIFCHQLSRNFHLRYEPSLCLLDRWGQETGELKQTKLLATLIVSVSPLVKTGCFVCLISPTHSTIQYCLRWQEAAYRAQLHRSTSEMLRHGCAGARRGGGGSGRAFTRSEMWPSSSER